MTGFIGAGLLLMALIALVGVWVPRFRGVWKGSAVRMGTLSSAGLALCMGAVGVIFLAQARHVSFSRLWFGIALAAGFMCTMIGYTRDGADHRRASPAEVATHSRGAARDPKFAAMLVVFLMMLLINLFWR